MFFLRCYRSHKKLWWIFGGVKNAHFSFHVLYQKTHKCYATCHRICPQEHYLLFTILSAYNKENLCRLKTVMQPCRPADTALIANRYQSKTTWIHYLGTYGPHSGTVISSPHIILLEFWGDRIPLLHERSDFWRSQTQRWSGTSFSYPTKIHIFGCFFM
jgi:hypothetical protein